MQKSSPLTSNQPNVLLRFQLSSIGLRIGASVSYRKIPFPLRGPRWECLVITFPLKI